jgi:hypothetical protein
MANATYITGSVTVGTTPTKVCTVPMENDDVLVYCSANTVFGGPGVGLASANDVQTVAVGSATAGTFTLAFNGSTPSTAIAYNATAATVQSALQALPTIGSGNVTVTGTAPTWVATFGGALANAPQPLLTINGSGLTGGTPTVTHTTTGASGGVTVNLTTLTHIPSTGAYPHDLYAIASSTSTVAFMYPE